MEKNGDPSAPPGDFAPDPPNQLENPRLKAAIKGEILAMAGSRSKGGRDEGRDLYRNGEGERAGAMGAGDDIKGGWLGRWES